MIHLAGTSFPISLLRRSFAYYLLMMSLLVLFQGQHYHSIRTKENTEVAVVADLESADRMISHSSRPPPQPPAASMLISGGTSVTLSVTTKKPLYSSPFYTSYSESNSPLFLVSSSSSSSSASSASEDEPHFDAIISYDTSPSDPCYNFTIGNARLREFYSPNYPFNYPNATECERVIIAPHGHQIRIEFRDKFHLENTPNCEYDYLEIRDGAYGYSNQLAKLCGRDFPRDVTSNDRYLFLRFVSDVSIEYPGFRAVYTYIKMSNERPEPPLECRFNRSGVSGVIKNQDIPIELTNYSVEQQVPIDCMWNITVKEGYKMYLNFKEYKLATPNNCDANYIDIYGDKLSDIGRKHRFCGTQAEPVRSDGNHMNIRFFAKPDSLNSVQFDITFTAFRELPNKERCREDEFDCEDSTCIDISLRCDGTDNCKYRYDEDKQTTCAPGNKGMLNLNSQHMVVILIVFCALVFGMCASITISCWSKIEERRLRKREYKLRRSRETSMEVGLDRTMTITSLDRSTTGCPLEHVEQTSSSSGSRCRKIVTANAIRHKGDVVDDDVMDGPAMGYYDSEENGCYVPDVDITSMHHHPSSAHHHLVYPPSAERRAKQQQQQPQPNGGGTLCAGHHLDSVDKYSPDTPTPPQMMLGSPSGVGGAQSPMVAADYYHQQQQQNQMEHDSIRSGSECSIPPPPPPPALSHFRNRFGQPSAQPYRTLPLDASKLGDQGMMMMGENPHPAMTYRHPQHMPQRMGPVGPMSLSQQQLMMQPQPQQHHPDCAQHQLNKKQQPEVNYNLNSLRRNQYYNRSNNAINSSNNRPSSMPMSSGDNVEMLNDDVDDCGMIEGDGRGGGGEHQMELNDDVLDEDVLTDNDVYPNGRLASISSGPPPQQQQQPQQQHYLLRAQSTLDEEDDSSVPLNSTNSNPGYGSNTLTPGGGHPGQLYHRSEAILDIGGSGDNSLTNSSSQLRQGVAIMR